MAIGAILIQPPTDSINAGYRPILFRVSATKTDGTAIPPVVYCDIYISGSFYKTVSKTQYTKKNTTNSEWEFDVQDAVQEYCQKYIEDNGQASILDIPFIVLPLFCKFRSSGIDTEGFIAAENSAPVQGTFDTAPLDGTGTVSNTVYAVNATLQHEDNQNLAQHLSSYKNRTWDTTTYPLTHRPDNYYLCTEDSDSFPIISDKVPAKLTLKWKDKNGITGSTDQNIPCVPVSITSSPADLHVNPGQFYQFVYRLAGSGPYSLSGVYNVPGFSVSLASDTTGPMVVVAGVINVLPFQTLYALEFTVSNTCGTVSVSDNIILNTIICEPVTIDTAFLPAAIVGQFYEQTIILSGTAPYSLIVNAKPAWCNVLLTNVGSTVVVTVSGTPGSAYLNQPQTIDIKVTNACGVATKTYIFSVISTSKQVFVINATGGDLNLICGGVPFFYAAGENGSIYLISNTITIQTMTGSHEVDTVISLPSTYIDTFLGRVQGDVFTLSDPSNTNYIWFKP